MTKSELRRNVLKKRDEIPQDEQKALSELIACKIKEWDIYNKSKNLLTFVNFRSEVATQDLIVDAINRGKKVYCPKVHGTDMFFYRINSLEDLVPGYKGILEPREGLEVLNATKSILMLMPGSVFDKDGNRIGYGGGYYDKFLAFCKENDMELVTAALGYSMQVFDNIPVEEHDYRVDYIFTEKDIFECNGGI